MHRILIALMFFVMPQDAAADPEARAIFNAAVKVQCPDGTLPEIIDFKADMSVSLYEKEAAGPKSGRCVQYWQRNQPRSRYHRVLSISGGKTTHLATDGLRFLLWEEGGRVQDLLDDPALKDDLRTLKDEMRRTEELLSSLFLQRMDKPGMSVRFAGPASTIKRGEPAEDVPVRTLVCRNAGEADVQLVIGIADQRLYAVDRAAVGDKPAQAFRFDFHALGSGKSANGEVQRLLLPRRVEYCENGRLLIEANARKASDLQFNTGLEAASFAPPK